MTNTTGTIQTHLQLNARTTDSHQQVRSTILNYVRAQRQFGPTPMDICQVGKGRKANKGKYTSSGKGKGNYDSEENYTENTSSYKGHGKGKGKPHKPYYKAGQKGTGKGQYKSQGKGKAPYYKGKGNYKGNVHAVTYDENDYSWDATSPDIEWYPNTEAHTEWGHYNGWDHSYPQQENWYEGYTPQGQGCTESHWIQSTSATPVQNTVNDLRSSLSNGSASTYAKDARMST